MPQRLADPHSAGSPFHLISQSWSQGNSAAQFTNYQTHQLPNCRTQAQMSHNRETMVSTRLTSYGAGYGPSEASRRFTSSNCATNTVPASVPNATSLPLELKDKESADTQSRGNGITPPRRSINK